MQLLGKNLASLKKTKGKDFTPHYGVSLLLQILEGIEGIHGKGYIHRDIKPVYRYNQSNLVTGRGKKKGIIYLIDFGLAKLHLNPDGTPIAKRESADFRGTITFASLNAHNKIVYSSTGPRQKR
jgi:serine/threonine protein kinase